MKSIYSFRSNLKLALIISFILFALVDCQFSMLFNNRYDLKVWMPNSNTVRFQATVPNNQYFSIGFGKTMSNCDMVIWQANGNNS